MKTKNDLAVADPEISAINLVHNALKSLDVEAQLRAIQYVVGKLGISSDSLQITSHQTRIEGGSAAAIDEPASNPPETQAPSAEVSDGISPVAQKWMRRSGFEPLQLAKVFSVGDDEIDLIAESVPGKSKSTKMHNVILLKGIAAYLASGAARITHQQIKETCLHYDAFDSANFATYLKGFSAEVSGSKESGYTLTPRGITGATNLVRQMIQA